MYLCALQYEVMRIFPIVRVLPVARVTAREQDLCVGTNWTTHHFLIGC